MSSIPILDGEFDPEKEFNKIKGKLKINISSLNSQMAEQPAMFGFYIVRYRLLKSWAERLKASLSLLENDLIEKARERYEQLGKKYTETQLRSEALSSPDYFKAHKEYHDVNRKLAITEGIIEALRSRHEMLVSIGYNLRFEREVSVKE